MPAPFSARLLAAAILVAGAAVAAEPDPESPTAMTSTATQPTAADSAAIVFPAERWQSASPESQGMDAALVQAAVDHVASICGPDGVSQMMIVRNGYVIWQGDAVESRHTVWSCTKSFTSSCLGLLWDDGRLAPDTHAAEIYPPLAEHYPGVTLEHLATFTSGYAHADGQVLEPAPPMYATGAALHYSDQSDLLAALLTRQAGKPLATLFRQRLGAPIGITDEMMAWGEFGELDGLTLNGGSGGPGRAVQINAVGMARFGWLYANNGVWDGKRLISQRYIDYATVPRTTPKLPPHDPEAWYTGLPGNYGLNWWTNGPRPDGKPHWPSAPTRTFAAQGNRNNNCFIVPEWRLVVVRLGSDKIVDMRQYDRMFELLGQAQAKAE